MSFREEILRLGLKPGSNVRELCRRFQISAKTFYKWRKRAQEGGAGILANRSRRPHQSPRKSETRTEHKILEIREEHPSWGARKIRRVLTNQKEVTVPAHSTVHRILQRNGKIDATESKKHQAWLRFEHEAPNQLWQMDFKGWFATNDEQRCNPLTVLDDHSRYVVCLQACANQRTETVQRQLSETFRCYGLPERITMDNGSPWGNDREHPYTPLTVWLIRLGIGVSHSRPFHPQTQGKDERFHRTLGVDLLDWHQFRDLRHVQKHFDEYRHVYNHDRPHQALDFDVPASRYRMSVRSFVEQLPPIEYDVGDIVRKVQSEGRIQYSGNSYRRQQSFPWLSRRASANSLGWNPGCVFLSPSNRSHRSSRKAMSLCEKACGNCRGCGNPKERRISTAAWKTRRQQRAGFPTVPTGSTTITSPRVTYVPEHVLPMSPVLTRSEGRGGLFKVEQYRLTGSASHQ